MKVLSLALVAVVAISASSFAQCSTLTITGSINAGQTVVADVSGAPANSLVWVAIGDAGSTTIPLPGNSLSLGVANPIFLPIGMSDASGHVALSVDIPANIPANVIQNHTFTVQAVSASFSFSMPMPSFTICVSNTASLVSGTG